MGVWNPQQTKQNKVTYLSHERKQSFVVKIICLIRQESREGAKNQVRVFKPEVVLSSPDSFWNLSGTADLPQSEGDAHAAAQHPGATWGPAAGCGAQWTALAAAGVCSALPEAPQRARRPYLSEYGVKLRPAGKGRSKMCNTCMVHIEHMHRFQLSDGEGSLQPEELGISQFKAPLRWLEVVVVCLSSKYVPDLKLRVKKAGFLKRLVCINQIPSRTALW